MKNYGIRFFSLLLLAGLFTAGAAWAQNADRPRNDEITNILSRFKNYRFGAVNIYEIQNTDELKEALKNIRKSTQPGQKEGEASGEECAARIEEPVRDLIRFGAEEGRTTDQVISEIINQGYAAPPREDVQCAYDWYMSQLIGGGEQMVLHAYVVTTKPDRLGALPDTIIGLILVEREYAEDTQEIKPNLENVSETDIYSINAMTDIPLDQNRFGYDNLYSFVYSYFLQGNVADRTLEARGIGTDIRYFPEQPGKTTALIEGERVGEDDIQRFIRVSSGQPLDYYTHNNIVVLSPDLIRYTRYKTQYLRDRAGNIRTDTLGNPLLDDEFAANDLLPQIGVELKYGLEEINYPSFWSERMTLSALWRNVKLGAILPTSGWAGLGKSLYGVERTLTSGGLGIAGELDFPIALIPSTGVFHLAAGYVFGDANRQNTFDPDGFAYQDNNLYNDYLIRTHGQLHYTFGVAIDEDYMMRFGAGATVYMYEKWRDRLIEDENRNPVLEYYRDQEEWVGGISGRIDFMATNITTPFGGTLQYFDEGIYVNAWLQIPIVEETLSLRFDANGYFAAFREVLRPWESRSIFMPMARLIVAF